MKKSILIIISLLILIGCIGEEFYKFNLINNTNRYIYFTQGRENRSIYPDTLIEKNPSYSKISAYSTLEIGGLVTIERIFERENIDTLSIYFFDADVVDNIPWETVREEYKVLKRYDLSIEDIQLLDYEITYPPTEQMKNMRMYPPLFRIA